MTAADPMHVAHSKSQGGDKLCALGKLEKQNKIVALNNKGPEQFH